MTDNSMDQLTAFMEERARYQGWLAQLEARRDSTPPHVFDRVSGDYRERLQRVTEQLSSRAGDLENSAASLASRIAALFTDESTRKDERAEAELAKARLVIEIQGKASALLEQLLTESDVDPRRQP